MLFSVAGIARKEQRYLVVRRKPGTTIGERWEFPGGKVEPGEDPVRALQREFREELGVPIEVGLQLGSGTFRNGEREFRLLGYFIDLENEDFLLPEHQALRWVSLHELTTMDLADSDRILVDKLVALARKQRPQYGADTGLR